MKSVSRGRLAATLKTRASARDRVSVEIDLSIVGNDNQTLWYCSTDLSQALPTALVVGIGIADRAIVGAHELVQSAAGSFCNDLVMSPDGALWLATMGGG